MIEFSLFRYLCGGPVRHMAATSDNLRSARLKDEGPFTQ